MGRQGRDEMDKDQLTKHDPSQMKAMDTRHGSAEDACRKDCDESDDSHHQQSDEERAELLYELPTPPPGFDIVVNFSPPEQGNALQLHLPPASADNDVKPKSPIEINHTDGAVEAVLPLEQTSADLLRPKPFRVRFRSRVRIGSGIRHKRATSQPKALTAGRSYSPDSDTSLSSSISAPLRYTPDEVDSEGQLTKGSRNPYGSFALGPKRTRRASAGMYTIPGVGSKRSRHLWLNEGDEDNARPTNERTKLLRAPGSNLGARTRRRYGLEDEEEDGGEDEGDAMERRRREREMREMHNLMFGGWPWRLFNGYWWAWKFSDCCSSNDNDDNSDDGQNVYR